MKTKHLVCQTDPARHSRQLVAAALVAALCPAWCARAQHTLEVKDNKPASFQISGGGPSLVFSNWNASVSALPNWDVTATVELFPGLFGADLVKIDLTQVLQHLIEPDDDNHLPNDLLSLGAHDLYAGSPGAGALEREDRYTKIHIGFEEHHPDKLWFKAWIKATDDQITEWGLVVTGVHPDGDGHITGRADYHPVDPESPISFVKSLLFVEDGGTGAIFDVLLAGLPPTAVLGGSIHTLDNTFSHDLGPGADWSDVGGVGSYRFVSSATVPAWLANELKAGNLALTVQTTDPEHPLIMAPFLSLCPADFNEDGFVDGIDYDTFNNAFEAGDPSSDYNSDGFVDGIDYDEFNNAFEGGC